MRAVILALLACAAIAVAQENESTQRVSIHGTRITRQLEPWEEAAIVEWQSWLMGRGIESDEAAGCAARLRSLTSWTHPNRPDTNTPAWGRGVTHIAVVARDVNGYPIRGKVMSDKGAVDIAYQTAIALLDATDWSGEVKMPCPIRTVIGPPVEVDPRPVPGSEPLPRAKGGGFQQVNSAPCPPTKEPCRKVAAAVKPPCQPCNFVLPRWNTDEIHPRDRDFGKEIDVSTFNIDLSPLAYWLLMPRTSATANATATCQPGVKPPTGPLVCPPEYYGTGSHQVPAPAP